MGVAGVVVVKEPQEVAERLAALGLDVQTLIEALEAGLAERNACTENDPPSTRGYIGWARTVRRLRELLITRGWRRTHRRRLAAVVNGDNTTAVAVATGDERTGLDGDDPQSRYPKGMGWEAAVGENRAQLPLPGIPAADVSKDESDDQRDWLTWVLLFYVDPAGETRCELSVPSDMSAESRLDEWEVRILLPPIKSEPEPALEEPLPLPPIDVPVKRRNS